MYLGVGTIQGSVSVYISFSLQVTIPSRKIEIREIMIFMGPVVNISSHEICRTPHILIVTDVGICISQSSKEIHIHITSYKKHKLKIPDTPLITTFSALVPPERSAQHLCDGSGVHTSGADDTSDHREL